MTKQKKPKTVLITSVDNQAVVGTVYSIREAFYSKIIGIDRKEKTIAQHMVDVFEVGADAALAASIPEVPGDD